jgi:hypothetical protein
MFPAKVRAVIYLVTVMLAAAYAVVESNVNLHWGWQAGYAAWNALAGVLAVSNTPGTAPVADLEGLSVAVEEGD